MKLHTRNPVLEFKDEPKLRESLSAAVFAEQDLWVASDETTSIERLSTDEGLIFRHHKTFLLEQLITLPAVGTDLDQEVDIEGMDRFDSYLWVIGSHSVKRKKVDSKDPDGDEKLIKKLAKTEDRGNRCLLARIPIIENGSSGELVRSTDPEPSGNPILNAGSLAGDVRSDALTDAIRTANGGGGDPHLARFLDIPGKDNGFDIEGLAVTTNKAFVGLRGPVLRGWAVILEVSFQDSDEAELMLKDFDSIVRPYRKHFIDLKGLGVRELCLQGNDLLILAGPTMNLDGPTCVYRWKAAVNTTNDSVIRGNTLVKEIDIPFGSGNDHPEGMAVIPNTNQILVVYDSPGNGRKVGSTSVKADVFDLSN